MIAVLRDSSDAGEEIHLTNLMLHFGVLKDPRGSEKRVNLQSGNTDGV